MNYSHLASVVTLIFIACVICGSYIPTVLGNPFHFPYFDYTFDVSGKRNVDIENYIDEFLNDPENWKWIQEHEHRIWDWEDACLDYINTCRLKKLRIRQFEEIKDVSAPYRFYCTRSQTRYRQVNYQKIPYQTDVISDEREYNFDWLSRRYEKLEEINHEATLKEYHAHNQRKLMTKALREGIMKRDNYTCQLCGKYMPDEVGLQIDHIIPVSRGGKTVASNLRVLCNKCNTKKGKKYDEEM